MILARAPLRVTLGGGGTDLPSYYSRHGGFVLSAAIDKYIYVHVNRPPADDLIRVKYSRYEEVSAVEDIQHDLVRPTLKLLEIKDNIEIASMADVPAGTGLGSSASYLVALLTALRGLKRQPLPPGEMAELAYHVEHDLAGHPVGKQDHYLASFGGITNLRIGRDGQVDVTPLEIRPEVLDELNAGLMLFFTGVTRRADDILVTQAADTDRDESVTIESLHRTKEIGLEIKSALEAGDVTGFGELMHAHWENKKRRSDAISDGRVDRCYDAARGAGALGGKLVGAGGGGFLMMYCPRDRAGAVREAMAAAGLKEMRFEFEFEGAKVTVNF